MTGYCPGCNAELVPSKAPGRKRKWCSERCRRKTLYSVPCVDCGKMRYTGSEGTLRCAACALLHARSMPVRLAASHRSQISATGYKYTDAEIFAAIRLAADCGRVSVNRYESQVANEGLGPTKALLVFRFGSWRSAVHAAGLRCMREATPERYANRMDDEGLLAAIEDCAADLGYWPGSKGYSSWAVGGRGPTVAIFRQRFGTWHAALAIVVGRWNGITPWLAPAA